MAHVKATLAAILVSAAASPAIAAVGDQGLPTPGSNQFQNAPVAADAGIDKLAVITNSAPTGEVAGSSWWSAAQAWMKDHLTALAPSEGSKVPTTAIE